jgi:alginate O-acetyltransferase complex protein AlgI
MVFSSFAFLLLFPPAALAWAWMRQRGWHEASQWYLLLLSLGFYCWYGLYSLPFLAGSIVFNQVISKRIGRPDSARVSRRKWLIFGLTANLVFLSCFKYVNFFLSWLGPLAHFRFTVPDLRLPLGISFFTLNQIMYLVDCYEDLIPPSSLFDHAAFVSFFPSITSGPLMRSRAILAQFRDVRGISSEAVARGFVIFAMGLFKKCVLADSLARVADIPFSGGDVTRVDAWCGVVAYALQIYFDFCGYSEMALGVAKIMGIDIPVNFRSPYTSLSEIEFWQRWHISLSQFITTYLYTPIIRGFGGRATLAKSAVATMLAMTICGLWHGPAWTFVLWGMLHGVALAVNQFWRKKVKIPIPALFCWLMTFSFATFADIFFRAPSVPGALAVMRNLAAGQLGGSTLFPISPDGALYVIPAILAVPIAFLGPSAIDLMQSFTPTWRASLAYSAMVVTALVFLNSVSAKVFIYFAF